MYDCFLTLGDDQPMGICISDDSGERFKPLDEFLEESKQGMGKAEAARCAVRLQQFVNELKDYSNDSYCMELTGEEYWALMDRLGVKLFPAGPNPHEVNW